MSGGRLPAPARRRQLLEVAREVYAEAGYHEASMADIAEAAGVTKPVLYQHFASKAELFGAVLTDTAARLKADVLDAARTAPEGRAQVEAAFGAYVAFARTDPSGFRLLHAGSWQTDPAWAETVGRFEALITAEVARLLEFEGTTEAQRLRIAHGLFGLAEGIMRHQLALDETGDPGEVLDDLITLAWGGLRGLERH